MANLSDLLTPEALPAAPPPAWLARLGAAAHPAESFSPGLPLAPVPGSAPDPAPAAGTPASETVPAPAPESDPIALAYAEGEAAGRAAAEAEAAAARAAQRGLRLTLRRLDEAALALLAEDLAATVLELCAPVLGEAAIDRAGLVQRCKAAATRIGTAPDRLVLHLNPDDLALIGPDALPGWRIAPDPALARGSLRLEGPEGAVCDGPEEWARALAAALKA